MKVLRSGIAAVAVIAFAMSTAPPAEASASKKISAYKTQEVTPAIMIDNVDMAAMTTIVQMSFELGASRTEHFVSSTGHSPFVGKEVTAYSAASSPARLVSARTWGSYLKSTNAIVTTSTTNGAGSAARAHDPPDATAAENTRYLDTATTWRNSAYGGVRMLAR